MKILQRYILLELSRVLLLIVCVMTVLLVFVGAFDQISEYGLGLVQVLAIMPYIVPSLLPFTIPATLLLSICVVYGRLSADYEITAAKAAGINVLSLLFPAFFLGTILTVCSLLLNDQVIPWSVGNMQRITTLGLEDIFYDVLSSQNMIDDPQHGYSITVSGVDLENRKLLWPHLRYSMGDTTVVAQAREATIRFDLEREETIVHLWDTWIGAPGEVSAWCEETELPFPLPLPNEKPKARYMTIETIHERMSEMQSNMQQAEEAQTAEAAIALATGNFERLSESGFQHFDSQIRSNESNSRKANTELHNRFALSCSCFFFALVGGPFSILQARRQFLTTFFLCFMPILLAYYPIVLLMMNLSKTGSVNPAWASWCGNAILLVASIFVLRKAIKH
jgi:lipopolysaccharide export system permease protein